MILKLEGSGSHISGDAEAEIVGAFGRVVSDGAMGKRAEGRDGVPTASADSAEEVLRVLIPAPLPHISGHVVEVRFIRCLAANGFSPRAAAMSGSVFSNQTR